MHRLIHSIISLTIIIITIMGKRISIYCLSLTIRILNQSKIKDIRLSNRLGIFKDMNQNNKVRKLFQWSSQNKIYRPINPISQNHIPNSIKLTLSLKLYNSNHKFYHQVDFNREIRYNIANITISAGKNVENSM